MQPRDRPDKMVINATGPLSTKSAKTGGMVAFGLSQSSSTTAANNRSKLAGGNAFGQAQGGTAQNSRNSITQTGKVNSSIKLYVRLSFTFRI